jgi:hypothetical protein
MDNVNLKVIKGNLLNNGILQLSILFMLHASFVSASYWFGDSNSKQQLLGSN